ARWGEGFTRWHAHCYDHKVSLMSLRYVSSRAEAEGWKLIIPIFRLARSNRSLSWFCTPPEKWIRIFLGSGLSAELTLARDAISSFTVRSSMSLNNSISTMFHPSLEALLVTLERLS